MSFYGKTFTKIHGILLEEDSIMIKIRIDGLNILKIPKRFTTDHNDPNCWLVETWLLKRFRIIPLYDP